MELRLITLLSFHPAHSPAWPKLRVRSMEIHHLLPPRRTARGPPTVLRQVRSRAGGGGVSGGTELRQGWGQGGGHTLTLLPPPTDSSEGALEGMVRGLRLGGVSLLGQQQPLTQEQWRSSFMRRNRDPQLNERVHRVRALQSTLKVSRGRTEGWALG